MNAIKFLLCVGDGLVFPGNLTRPRTSVYFWQKMKNIPRRNSSSGLSQPGHWVRSRAESPVGARRKTKARLVFRLPYYTV